MFYGFLYKRRTYFNHAFVEFTNWFSIKVMYCIIITTAFTDLCYLGSTIDRRGGASKDVDNRVAKAWSKWREVSGVICDKKIPTKLKLLIYQTVIRPTLLYGCETWPMSVKDEKRQL